MFWLSLKKKFKNTLKVTNQLLAYKKELENTIQELKQSSQAIKTSTINSFYKLLDTYYFVGKIIITTSNNIPRIVSKFPRCFNKITNTNMVLKVVDQINHTHKQGNNDLHLSINNLPYKEWILSVHAPRLNNSDYFTVTGNNNSSQLENQDLNLTPTNVEVFHRNLNKKSDVETNKTYPITNNSERNIDKPFGSVFFKFSYGERSNNPIDKMPAHLEVVIYKVVAKISEHISGEVFLEELLNE